MRKAEAKVPFTGAVDYMDLLSQCEKVAKIQSLSLSNETRMSTGLLSLDAILGGGVTAGMYTFFGPEQSAKTTAAITVSAASIDQEVGSRILWDAENSSGSSTDYIANIFQTLNVKADVETVFGVKKDGKYIVKPLIYYRDEGEAETFFDFVSALLRRLPNKRYEDKRWWLVYPKDKEHLATFGEVMDKKLSQQNGAIYVPTANSSLQSIIILDSWPALVPAEADEDDPSGGLALQARAFSDGMKRIKGKLRAKRVSILSINQLRKAPMVRFGCLHGDTMIPFTDGRSFPIGEIVNKRIKGNVWSINEDTGKIESKAITGWHNNGNIESKKEWITINFELYDTANGVGSVTVTPDHEILTDRGWKQARRIREGDNVVSKFSSIFNGKIREFLTGTLCGDSCLVGGGTLGRNSNKAVVMFQDSENEEYLLWKEDVLSNVMPMKTFMSSAGRKVLSRRGGTHELALLKRLLGNRNPLSFRRWTPLSFAMWFMDDGTFKGDRNVGSICFKRFKKDPSIGLQVRDLLESHGYETADRNDNGSVHFTRTGFDTFCKDICKYVPECMQYKLLPKYRGKYKKLTLKKDERQVQTTVRVTSIVVGSDRKFRWTNKFDISVQDNHNYLAGNKMNGIIVHNSPDYEPGGEAIKFYSDVRLKMYPHAVSSAPFNCKGEGMIEKEKSLDGGEDTYRYIKATAIKNKLSVPNRFTWLRLWVEDSEGNGRGYDPVFDTFYALMLSGQIDPLSSKKNIRLHPHGRDAFKKTMSWLQFKALVIGTKEQKQEVWSYLGSSKIIDLRKYVRRQMATDLYENLYIETRRAKAKPVEEEAA